MVMSVVGACGGGGGGSSVDILARPRAAVICFNISSPGLLLKIPAAILPRKTDIKGLYLFINIFSCIFAFHGKQTFLRGLKYNFIN